MNVHKHKTMKDRMLWQVERLEQPITSAELARKTRNKRAPVAVALHALVKDGKVKTRLSASRPGVFEYWSARYDWPAADAVSNDDEVPDHIWWPQQEALGFRRLEHNGIWGDAITRV